MIADLDEAGEKVRSRIEGPDVNDLRDAILEGAVQRARPKIMTVATTIIGLLPIFWSHGAEADTMKRCPDDRQDG